MQLGLMKVFLYSFFPLINYSTAIHREKASGIYSKHATKITSKSNQALGMETTKATCIEDCIQQI